MKSYKQIISEVAQPKPADEINFKAKHEIEFMDHPASEEGQHTSGKTKSKRIADYKKGQDRKVYEDAEEENGMIRTQLSFIKYACDEIMEYVETGVDTEEWFQNKLARVHGDMTTLHAYMEGDKRKDGNITMDDMMVDESEEINEEEMTDAQMKRREEIVKGMKKNKEDMQKRYGDNWKAVMYATATKMAMEESLQEAKMTDDHWVIVNRNGNFYSAKSEIKKIVRASKNPPSQKVIERHGGDGAIRVGELRKKLKNAKDTGDLLKQLGEVKIYEKQIDKVNKDAMKKDFDDRADMDIDNDGEVDDQDEYLHNRRKTIAKAIKKDEVSEDDDNPCWKGYEMIGMKKGKNGEEVPNCVPKESIELDENSSPSYKEGKKAAYDAKKYGENPYKRGTKDHLNWSKGHNDARVSNKSIRGKSSSLKEATQPTWEVSVRKAFNAGGVKVKKGDSVEVKARNTAEAIDKAMNKMGISKKDGMAIQGNNFDLKKLKESLELDEAVKAGNLKLNDGSRVKVTKDEADAINNLLGELSSAGRKKMEKDMMKNKKEFDNVVQFAKEAM